jgi:hypothetical protein
MMVDWHDFIVPNGKTVKVIASGTMTDHLQVSLPKARPADNIVVQIYYPSPGRLDVFARGSGQIAPSSSEALVTAGAAHGTNYLNKMSKFLSVTVSGNMHLDIKQRAVVAVSMLLAVSVENFFAAGFIGTMAASLKINPDRIRVVSVVPGNSRRRLLGMSDSEISLLGDSAQVDTEIASADPCDGVNCGAHGTCR